MIYGIGADLVSIERMRVIWRRYGQRSLHRFLAETERDDCLLNQDQGRFLAKRFAAKEALAKALGTGMRPPLSLTAIAVKHDALGKPAFVFDAKLSGWIERQGLRCLLSISDEEQMTLACVVVEKVVMENAVAERDFERL